METECECKNIAGYGIDGLCSHCVNIWLRSAKATEKLRIVQIIKETMPIGRCWGNKESERLIDAILGVDER